MSRLDNFHDWDDLYKLIPDYCKEYQAGLRYNPGFDLPNPREGVLKADLVPDKYGECVKETDAVNAIRAAYAQGMADAGKSTADDVEKKSDLALLLANKIANNFFGTSISKELITEALRELIAKEMEAYDL